ncbi:amidase signature domain-containing protein [Clohesyomyces aquaticus]|uniref:Amidase signature domain-containing protein n=1 Tax=Clohesyomyces aquaticus TaxID=1231657 RepID=A0A1Y1YTA3_9PLEO|nr:amidase signature domain-containing protein [Clohesyomyces aquaticus]
MTSSIPNLDVLNAAADDLRQQLNAGTITSVDIVKTYLSHIQKHKKARGQCNTVRFTAPTSEILAQAATLDTERSQGKLRGPIHGAPILLKDCIATSPDLGMPTTLGSRALLTSRPYGNSDVVKHLLSTGLIITVTPSAVAGLYTLKLTPGSISLREVFALTRCFDTVRAMGKSARDVAMDSVEDVDVEDIAVGFVDIETWRLPKDVQGQDPEYFAQTEDEYNTAKETLRKHGIKVKDVYITLLEKYMVGDGNAGDAMNDIVGHQSKKGFDDYLATLQYPEVRTPEDINKYNDAHSDAKFTLVGQEPAIHAS